MLAYLPMAWVGDHIFSYAQSIVTGFTVNCPESAATVLHDGIAQLQAGAGIVADSDPASEHEECLRKLAAVEAAIDLAEAEQR